MESMLGIGTGERGPTIPAVRNLDGAKMHLAPVSSRHGSTNIGIWSVAEFWGTLHMYVP